jgi:HB1, ASXL, restriction endonuclease HTH domain
MGDRLEEALAMSQTAITEGLADAKAELERVRGREAELEALIARGEAALGIATGDIDREGRLTLHDALEQILRENDNRWMTVHELADEINRRALYRKKDGSAVEPNQVHARTKNYNRLFEKEGPRIRLRVAVGEWDVVIFRDDDDGFHAWLDAHDGAFFINAERNPKPNYLVLHIAGGCGHFDLSPSVHWTRDYIKICSDRREQLEGWAEQTVGGEVTLCGSCFR